MRQELDNIIKKYDLINQTFENFWETYDTYLTDELTKEESKSYGLIDRNSIRAELYGYSFCVSSDLSFDYIKVTVDCFLKGKTMRFATYWCIYSLDGELFDDCFYGE
ncbi:MAG: hypothetical protein IJ644_09200 [Oscillospiraceae bacterium]|nr:hypothetical protein [Oscillospiraceae bacterium]